MKKLTALLLVVAFVCVGTIGCGDTGSKPPAGKNAPSSNAGSGAKPGSAHK